MSILSPVVKFGFGKIEPPFGSTGAAKRSFSQAAYPPGRRYDVLNQGSRVGSAVVRGLFPPECGIDTVAWMAKVEIDPASLMRDTTLRLVAVDPGTSVGNRALFKASVRAEIERLRKTSGNGERIVLYDVLDLDGDSVPELLVEAHSYEGFVYKTYSRRNGSWSAIYESPYYGC